MKSSIIIICMFSTLVHIGKAGLSSMQDAIINSGLEDNSSDRSSEMALTATILGLNRYGCWCYFEDIDRARAFGKQIYREIMSIKLNYTTVKFAPISLYLSTFLTNTVEH